MRSNNDRTLKTMLAFKSANTENRTVAPELARRVSTHDLVDDDRIVGSQGIRAA